MKAGCTVSMFLKPDDEVILFSKMAVIRVDGDGLPEPVRSAPWWVANADLRSFGFVVIELFS